MEFVFLLFVPHLSFSWCLWRAVLRDCDLYWVSSLIILQKQFVVKEKTVWGYFCKYFYYMNIAYIISHTDLLANKYFRLHLRTSTCMKMGSCTTVHIQRASIHIPAVHYHSRGSLNFFYYILSNITLVLLNPDIPCLCKQCRSRSVGFLRSQLI